MFGTTGSGEGTGPSESILQTENFPAACRHAFARLRCGQIRQRQRKSGVEGNLHGGMQTYMTMCTHARAVRQPRAEKIRSRPRTSCVPKNPCMQGLGYCNAGLISGVARLFKAQSLTKKNLPHPMQRVLMTSPSLRHRGPQALTCLATPATCTHLAFSACDCGSVPGLGASPPSLCLEIKAADAQTSTVRAT